MGFPLSVLFIVLLFQECLAGVMIDQVMKDREGTSSRVTLYFSGERLRTDDVDHGLSTIMDFKGDRMVVQTGIRYSVEPIYWLGVDKF